METNSKDLRQERNNNLKVASCSVTELFSNNSVHSDDGYISGQLTIPEYQRPYTWQAKELGKLLTDLLNYFANISEHQDNRSQVAKHNYYLGSIILHQETKVINGEPLKLLNVIDGQQRLTSLALLAYWIDHELQADITYSAPSSQQQIAKNIVYLNEWLAEQHELDLAKLKQLINFENINVTIVVTDSEDDAYRFFETENTGGVRLNGADIIKAHHLRATEKNLQDNYARQWEALGELSPLLDAVMKVRYWQAFNFKKIPSHRTPQLVKNEVVKELSESCNNKAIDNVAFRSVQHIKQYSGWLINTPEAGYAMRQPLNSGINAIDYLTYFAELKQSLLVKNSRVKNQDAFNHFYSNPLIQDTHGTAYLKKLFDSSLLLYVSQFGTSQLFEVALWLFRMVYSPRLVNQKAVRESTIQAFVRDNHLFDTIMMSFTHQQLVDTLSKFTYVCDNTNAEGSGAKGGFIGRVEDYFDMPKLDRKNISNCFDKALVKGIKIKLSKDQPLTSKAQEVR